MSLFWNKYIRLYLNNDKWIFYSCIILFAWVMYPAILYGDFIFHDDISGTYEAICPYKDWMHTLGRSLGGLIICSQFKLLPFIDPVALRCLNIFFLLVLMMSIYKFIRREGFPSNLAILMALGVLILPGMQVFISWLAASYIIFALMLSLFSALICQQITQKINASVQLNCLFFVIACGLELASLFVHQNGGMFFLVFLMLASARALEQKFTHLFRTVAVYSVNFIIANLMYLIYFKIYIEAALAHQDITRGVLLQNIMGRFSSFLRYSLPRGLNLWFNITSTGWSLISVIILIIFIVSIRYLFASLKSKNIEHYYLKIAIYLTLLTIMVVGCYLPTFLSQMPLDFFRALIPLSALFFLLACTHFWLGNRNILLVKILTLCMIAVSLYTNKTMLHHMIMPKYLEFQLLKNLAYNIKLKGLEYLPIHIIRAGGTLPETDGLGTDEIGSINSTFQGNAACITENFLKKNQILNSKFSDSLPSEHFDLTGKIVLDFSFLTPESLKQGLTNFSSNLVTVFPKIAIKKISASSKREYGPEGLFESKEPGWHSAAPPSYPETIHIAFKRQQLDGVRMLAQYQNIQRAPKLVQVRYSLDGTHWKKTEKFNFDCNHEWRNIQFKNSIEASYIDIIIYSNCGNPDLLTLKGLNFYKLV